MHTDFFRFAGTASILLAVGSVMTPRVRGAIIISAKSNYTESNQTDLTNSRGRTSFGNSDITSDALSEPGGVGPDTGGSGISSGTSSAFATGAPPFTYAYTANSITGSASSSATATNGTGQDAHADGFIDFEFLFTVDQAATFTATATLNSSSSGASVFRLQASDVSPALFNETSNGTFTENGSLTPGVTYDLFVQEVADADVRTGNSITTSPGAFTFDLETQSLPEPSSIGLLGLVSVLLSVRPLRRQQNW